MLKKIKFELNYVFIRIRCTLARHLPFYKHVKLSVDPETFDDYLCQMYQDKGGVKGKDVIIYGRIVGDERKTLKAEAICPADKTYYFV